MSTLSRCCSAAFILAFPCFSVWSEPLPANYSIACTTSVAEMDVWSDGQLVHLKMEDSAGFDDFPIYEGTVTPAMLGIISRGATDLKVLDGEMEITWDAKGCTFDPKRPNMMSCKGPGTMSTPKTDSLKVFGLATSSNHEETMEISADVLNIRVTMFTNDQQSVPYFLVFPFAADHCESSLTPTN